MVEQQLVAPQAMQNEIRGIGVLSDIDKYNIADIEGAKTKFLANYKDYSLSDAQAELTDLASNMQMVLEKYFAERDRATGDSNLAVIKKFKFYAVQGGEGYDFYQIRDSITQADDKLVLRKVAEAMFSIYNSFLKMLNVALPTSKQNWKERSNP